MISTEEKTNVAKVKPDYRHAYPVAVLVVLAIIAAAIARSYFVPKTFGEMGYYRAAALDEEKERQPRHVGKAACAKCHDDVAAIHAKDVHASVECESCHGPGWKHVKDPDVKLLRPNTKENCLTCHRLMDARFGSFPQIDWKKHFQFVGVKDSSIACIRCHSPHEPLYMNHNIHAARLHPLVHDCGECHIGRTDASLVKPQDHPAIFQCDYCHADLVKSFKKGSHTKLHCKACHLFIKENSFSGRIVRNADPKFCLLCHRKTEFKSASGPPTINWPSHITDISKDPADPKRPCVNCHQEQIHALYPKEKPHGL